MRGLAHRIVHARRFGHLLVILIIGSAISHGVGASVLPKVADWETSLQTFDWLIVILFALLWLPTVVALTLEALLKMFGHWPRVDRYFREGWNSLDFLIVSFLIIDSVVPTPLSSYAVLIVSVRLLRLLRGLSTVQHLHLILSTLFRSIPSLGHIMVLMGIVIYSYALVGFNHFGEHDPEHWGSLGVSVLSLFQIVTLDDWGNIMRTTIELEPLAWVYFVSFVISSAFIVTNLFIAVVIKNLDEARQERLRTLETPASKLDFTHFKRHERGRPRVDGIERPEVPEYLDQLRTVKTFRRQPQVAPRQSGGVRCSF